MRREVCITAAFVLLIAIGRVAAAAPAANLWVRLEVVENTAEGPAYDRCEVERTVKGAAQWSVFYGEARQGSDSGWKAVRPRSGCAATTSAQAPQVRDWRGSPYFIADISLRSMRTAEPGIRIEASLTLRKLSGFDRSGRPTYDRTSEKRTFQVNAGSSVVFPVLLAGQKEIDEFRIRELLLRFRAADLSDRKRVGYGKIAIASDIPRARILLDGSFVGWASAQQSVALDNVRTGTREIVVRDVSGREQHTEVQVQKGKTANVSLTFLANALPTTTDGLRSLGNNQQGREELWRETDGAIVVRIPGGEFQMGSPEGQGELSERPRHPVQLQSFLIDKTEVSWGQYQRFALQTGRTLPPSPVWGMPEPFAVSNVTWDDARAFCGWVGGRLPTEAEWERAARGDTDTRYSWGEDWDPWRCNTIDGGPHAPTAVGSFPNCVSPYGVLDVAGGVWEWCQDWYDAAYYAGSPIESPQGPQSGERRVSRGASWINPSSWARSAYRQASEPTWPYPLRGFRCAQADQRSDGK